MNRYAPQTDPHRLRQFATDIREGSFFVPPVSKHFIAVSGACAIGAAALIQCTEEHPGSVETYLSGDPGHYYYIYTDRIMNWLLSIELPFPVCRPTLFSGPTTLASWIIDVNDGMLDADPTCDPRPFIADCMDSLADYLEAT